MKERDLAEQFLRAHFTAAATLIALPLVRMWSNKGRLFDKETAMKPCLLAAAVGMLSSSSLAHAQTCASAVPIFSDSTNTSAAPRRALVA